jgi:hypothetical protein
MVATNNSKVRIEDADFMAASGGIMSRGGHFADSLLKDSLLSSEAKALSEEKGFRSAESAAPPKSGAQLRDE